LSVNKEKGLLTYLPSQLQSVTAVWPVTGCTAWWQTHAAAKVTRPIHRVYFENGRPWTVTHRAVWTVEVGGQDILHGSYGETCHMLKQRWCLA